MMLPLISGEIGSVWQESILAQSTTWLTWWPRILALLFAVSFGACVGSFLNVVIYRLPAGISIISPPSRCPTCGARLRFFRDNLPILGWLLLRGRCRYCGARISPQYMLIEVFVAVLFAVLTIAYFFIPPATGYWGDIGGAWWHWNGIKALPAFIALLVMFSALIAMTVIDARTFMIPMVLPMTVIVVAFLAWPVQALINVRAMPSQPWPIPLVSWTGFWIATGGMAGITASLALTKLGVLRPSFADYEEYIRIPEGGEGSTSLREVDHHSESGGTGEAGGSQTPLADYPHARREMLKEIVFLLPCIALMVAGYLVSRNFAGPDGPPLILRAIGASFAGYLVGGGIIWGVRILGTLGFGREAMGMGDVHLMAAVGAVLGWRDPIFIFVAAAFVGVVWAILSVLLNRLNLKVQRELPFGPHLAVAALLVVLLRPVIYGGTMGPGYWTQIEQVFNTLLYGTP